MSRSITLPSCDEGLFAVDQTYHSSNVVLHHSGQWRDDVGSAIVRVAEKAVGAYNNAEDAMWDSFNSTKDIRPADFKYEPQGEKLYAMKAEYSR